MKRTRSNCFNSILLVSFLIFSMLSQAQKPNIIFLLADDLRYNAIGCMGNSIVRTPHLDQLAKRGTIFTNAYVTTSICSISRASIFSGQYATRHKIFDFKTNFTDSARRYNFPALLKKHGYYTGFIGKYGVGSHLPADDYDFWKGIAGQGVFFYKDAAGNNIHSTDLMRDQAVEFIRSRNKSKPFCLQVSFKAPHVEDNNKLHNGYVYSPFYKDYYSKETIPPPPTGDDKFYLSFPETFRRSAAGITNEARVRWQQRFSTPEKYQESVKSYYRLITGMDDAVKRIVDELSKNGLEKNTVIIFYSDNGYALGDHGLEGKWFGQNVSIRVPAIIYDGRKPQEQHANDKMVLNIDLAPTILDYAGIAVPASMQGSSLKALVEGEVPSWRTAFYYEHQFNTEGSKVYLPMSEGLVLEKYKYMHYYNGPDPDNFFYETLFDQSLDPFEVNNLVNSPAMSLLKNEMIETMKKMRSALK